MKKLIETLKKKKTGHGHYYITIVFDNLKLGTTTTNTTAIDVAFDKSYDDVCNIGRYYETRECAQKALLNEILSANFKKYKKHGI